MAYNIVYRTSIFINKCKAWRKKASLDQTWTTFKSEFTLTHQDLRESQVTVMNAGYQDQNNIELQLVPPNLHSTNAAKKAIGLFKDQFISGLATVHPSFSLHLWCRLIPLEFSTLNLLRPSRINPKLLAYERINEVFEYNKTPLAHPGCKVLVGIAPDHYRCHRVDVLKTRAERIAQTVKLFPHNCKAPQNTSADVAGAMEHQLIAATT